MIPLSYLRRDIPVCAAYWSLDVVHHGKVPACSLIWVYYTRNAGFPQNNLVAIKEPSVAFQDNFGAIA